jgi:hypothetical protein
VIIANVKHYMACNRHFVRLARIVDPIKESRPVQWVLIREEKIAYGLYFLWLAGCAYWIYQFIIMDAVPRPDWLYIIEDTGEALMVLFFGSFGLLYVIGIALFIFKLIYNLFHGGIESIFPKQWQSAARSLSYLLILGISFMYIHSIKTAGLTAYSQVSQLMKTSDQHDQVVEKNIRNLMELLDLKQIDQAD